MSALEATNLSNSVLSNLVAAILKETTPAAQAKPVELSAICEKLADEAGASLAAIVPSVDFAVTGVQPCRLSEFAVSEYPAMFVLARQEDARDIILFRFSARSVDWWVSSSLGGSPARKPGDMAPISPIEVRVGRIAIDLTLAALVRVLSGFGIDLTIHECRTSAIVEDLPKFPDDPSGYAVSIALAPVAAGLTMSFFVSQAMAVDWSEKTSRADDVDSVAQGVAGDNDWPEELENQFSSVTVSIEAALTTELVELSTLLSWAPGQLIELQVTTETPVRFLSNEVPLFNGRLGRIDDRLSVQVLDAIEFIGVGRDAWTSGV